MRSEAEFSKVMELAAADLNISQIARQVGIARATVRAWLRDGMPPRMVKAAQPLGTGPLLQPFPWLSEHAYAYLLGLYLGDGHIARMARDVYMLRISLDSSYPRIVAEAEAAMAIVNPSRRAGVQSVQTARLKIVRGYSKSWPHLFPQHGPGPKHTRQIALADWQREICARFPARLVRGLIHSDGCRTINTIKHPKKVYRYPRYQFCNRSRDIRTILCEHLDLLGIEWRQMNRWNISIAKRGSVAEMDRLVGPKR